MKEAWITSCTSTIQHFVERSTRLQPDKLDLNLEEQIDFDYQINLSLDFRVELVKQTQAGSIRSSDSTLVFRDALRYKEALKAETSAVLSREETLREAHAIVLSRHYGELRKETVIYSHPRCLCLTENCTNCRGRGQVNCSSCGGSGKTSCSGCGGSGQVLEQKTVYDHYSKQHRTESHYRGCYSCSSSGKVRCSPCSGTGDQQCSPCRGTGQITQITKLNSVAIPDYQLIYFREDVQQFIKDGLYKVGIPNLQKFGNIVIADSKVDFTRNKVNFLYDAEVPFARFSSPLPQAQIPDSVIHWIIYGVRPQILDSGHVIELMLKNDLDNLVYAATPKRLLNPFIGIFSRKTVKIFMESEAHQDMLHANSTGKTGYMLREALNRAFSTDYLNEALTSLKSIISALQNWSVIKWMIFSSVIIYILMPFYTAYNNKWAISNASHHVYLTPYPLLDNQQNIQYSLKVIANSCGWFMLIAGLILPFIGYLWRRVWLQLRMGKQLQSWSTHKKILRSRWLVSLLVSIIFSTALLLFFPIWITQNGDLFGQYPIERILNLVIILIK